jgi:ATP-binding cassette subfamily B protein
VDISLFNLHKWRGMIGYVPQESSLLNVSILENIALQKEGANMERVLEICKMLNISEMIQRSPLGLLTPAGQEGNGLSGGECQKIAVARALYKDAQIYIFDEATSSLDPASEQCVLDIMVHLREKGKTVIFISHKETGESIADNVVTIK